MNNNNYVQSFAILMIFVRELHADQLLCPLSMSLSWSLSLSRVRAQCQWHSLTKRQTEVECMLAEDMNEW